MGVGALLAAAVVAAVALAAPGDLDPGFGGDGTVTTEIGSYGRAAWAVAIQPDGKVVVGGRAEYRFALARYTSDGSLDPTFDGDGMVTTQVGGYSESAYDIALQQDGKIVAVGSTAPGGYCCQFAVARFNPNGSPDTSFDGDGKVVTPFAGLTEAFAVAIQPDGKIVVGGHAYSPIGGGGFALARYNADGSLDTTFDGDGKVVTSFPGSTSDDAISAIAIQPDGKIVVSGSGGPGHDFLVARYTTTGNLDVGFDGDGTVATDFGGYDRGEDLAIQPDGRIVVAGTGNERLGIARYTSDGSLDTSFSEDGKATTSFPAQGVYSMRGYGVALQPNGKIVAVGSAFPEYGEHFALVRYDATGAVDTAFGNAGVVTTEFGPAAIYPSANDVALQPNGRIVAAGGRDGWLVARYLGDPVDTTPPVIIAPADLTENATSPAGAVVSFTVTATDEDPASPAVSCTPASGSVFAIGTTTVSCTATDTAGNTATASFVVTVVGAVAQLADLRAAVTGVGPGTSLADKVAAAQAALAADDVPETCSILAALVNQLNAQSGKSIDRTTAAGRIADAQRIRAVLGC